MSNELLTADRKAKTNEHDRFGVPLAFISVLENTSGITNVEPYPTELPLSLAPAAVKKAVSAANKAQDDLEAADDKAAELFAEYQAVPSQAQRDITAAVDRGDEPPSLSATVEQRQSKLAGPLVDAIALRDALQAKAIKAAKTAANTRATHRDDWRDIVAKHVVTELPKVRKQMEEAARVTASALNAANDLADLQRLCAVVDKQWLGERLVASEYQLSPYQTAQRPDVAIPKMYVLDEQHEKQRAANRWATTSAPVDVVGEIDKRVGWLGSYSDGGYFPNSLFIPLTNWEPVERDDT
ncbi:hypothetical protein ACIQ8G_25870 [Streptomyces sp. NPDC094154]|uniref:hypothetical protein n=1 Tax=Streptomyces sp. NPDC094154 TaxID=3366059 RepID=UPI0038045C16